MLKQSLSLGREFEMPYVVFEAGQGWLVRGIPSRESIEPSDPIERVRALPSEPLRALYGTCLQTASRPLPNCDTSGVSTFKYNQCTLVKLKENFEKLIQRERGQIKDKSYKRN